MMHWSDRSLPQKLAITTLSAIAGALVLAGLGFVAVDAWLFRESLRRDLTVLARVIADHSTAALAFNDAAAANEALGSLRERSHIRGGCIYQAGPPEVLFAKYLPRKGFTCPARLTLLHDDGLTLMESIILDDNQLGTLVLAYDLGELKERILLYGSTIVAVCSLAALAAFLLSGRMRATIAAPITELVHATRRVAETGDYSTRVPKMSGGELGLLVDRFNDMLAGIQGRDTDLKRALDRVGEERGRFHFMAESMPQKIFTATPEGVVDYVNSRWPEFAGRSVQDLIGGEWVTLLHPDDRERSIAGWQKALKSGNPFTSEQRFLRHDGVYRWHLSRAQAMRDQDGRITMWIGSNTDIHEQKEKEEELRRANEDLRQFAYSASHDLQEPIRNVAVFSELIGRKLEPVIDEEGRQFLIFLQEGARRLSRMVSGLLAYTNTSSAELSAAPVNAEVVVRRVLTTLEGTIRENEAIVTWDELPRVNMGEFHLEQIFQNLIGNAIKYRSERQPRIHISATEVGEAWRFSVSDNGIGIDPQYKERIFGLFKRLSHQSKYAGTGIGLAICQRIVERYGGHIWVEGQLGVGATFYFTIPQRPQPARSIAV